MTLTKAIIKIADSIMPAIGKQQASIDKIVQETHGLDNSEWGRLMFARDRLESALQSLADVRDSHAEELNHRNPQPL